MPALTVLNAEIKTAAVEVKTLTISGKQVTLAVFRQLREHPLISDEGTLNGVPWGTVNYHPDKCGDTGADHWHVVWQQDTELLRSKVRKRVTFASYLTDEDDIGGEFIEAHIRDVCLGQGYYWQGQIPKIHDGRYPHTDERYVEDVIHGVPVMTYVTGKTLAARRQWGLLTQARKEAETYGDRRLSTWDVTGCNLHVSATAILRAHHHLMDGIVADMTHEPAADLRRRVEAEVAAEKARRARHVAVREAIAELPQLFIAV